MNYYHHLKKLNLSREQGSIELWKQIVLYNLRFLFAQPRIISLFSRNSFKEQKKLFYTVLTGNYDSLNEINEKLPNWDYICFTDNEMLRSNSWDIRLFDSNLGLDPILLSRYYKINNHLVDEAYDLSVYVDANLRIRGNLDNFLVQAYDSRKSMALLFHPFLNSLEGEVKACIENNKGSRTLLRDQYTHYQQQGFLDRLPHINARLMIRKSGDPLVRKVMEVWYDQLCTWSKRDQISFNYALSRCSPPQINYVPYWLFRRYFKRMDHQRLLNRQ